MRERTKNRWWGIVTLVVALAAFGYSCRIIVLAAGQSKWAPAEATVVQSHNTQRTKGSGFTTHTSSHFAYRYEVEGRVYTANRHSFWFLEGDRSSGTQIYQPGDSLTI